tara:strand:+ start:754 stop:1830 length:1077 start_codon:yes stop_codon:yes gene_type:complete
MKISLTEEINKIKRLYNFKKGDTLLVEQGPKTKLPGPNYYEIQSFLEKKTGIDTGEPGFGNETSKALGFYLFGDKNDITDKKGMSELLTSMGYDTGGEGFGEDYATAVSDIIRKVETNSMDVNKLLENKAANKIIRDIINQSISKRLPYTEKFKLGEVIESTPPKDIDNDTVTSAWNKIRNIDMSYTINQIVITNYNNKKQILKGYAIGKANIGGLFKTDITGSVILDMGITENRYITPTIKSISLQTPYKHTDGLVDIGYQLLRNQIKLIFAMNLFPDIGIFGIGKGHTQWGPYYYNTPLQKILIKHIKIPTIDIGENKNQIKFRATVPKKKKGAKSMSTLTKPTSNIMKHKIQKNK